jgi:preprotein translocase subunit SecE
MCGSATGLFPWRAVLNGLADTMARTSPAEFARQVRQEVAKVTWPTRKETIQNTVMVFVMVLIASVFFFAADQVFSQIMRLLLSSL